MVEVYYVEDDNNIAELVKEYLEHRKCKVEIYDTIGAAKLALKRNTPDILLLDWNMPDGQGNDFCQWLRGSGTTVPIIFLTVRDDVRDIVSGFQSGADDYVVKPFELEVLYLRIQALLRRIDTKEQTRFYCDNISVDVQRLLVTLEGDEISVSQPEYQLLLLLIKNKGKTVTRKLLLEEIWDVNGNFVNDNTLTVTMKRLREKLGNPACIKTIRSFGYRMEDTTR